MFIDTKNVEQLMLALSPDINYIETEWEPEKQYLPPELKHKTENLIYLCIADKEVVKAYKRKEDAEEFMFQHNRYSFSKCSIEMIELE